MMMMMCCVCIEKELSWCSVFLFLVVALVSNQCVLAIFRQHLVCAEADVSG